MDTLLTVPKARAAARELLSLQPPPAPLTRIKVRWSTELAELRKGDTIQMGQEVFTIIDWQETGDENGLAITYELVPYVSPEDRFK